MRAFTREAGDEEVEQQERNEAEKQGEEDVGKEEPKKSKGDRMVAEVEKLSARVDEVSTELLAAVCYHHYHGRIEDAAFGALKIRAKENKHVSKVLLRLFKKIKSVCTVKGIADILAYIKHEQAFDFLIKILPEDVQTYPMGIAAALATLQDERAIPALVSRLNLHEAGGGEKPKPTWDNMDQLLGHVTQMLAEAGIGRQQCDCCFALGAYAEHASARAALARAAKDARQHLRHCARAVLWIKCSNANSRAYLANVLHSEGELDANALNYLESENVDEEFRKLLHEYVKKKNEKGNESLLEALLRQQTD